MPAEVASPKASPGGTSDFTRLHISPLDPELLKIILPSSVTALARNISYHTIETFPERRYGFVDLPNMEAEKLKRKLNGTVLKGNKLRVEKARPEERMEPTGDQDKEEEKKKKKSKKSSDSADGSKKRKRDPDVIEGVALTDRKVKRGWTEPADQRRKKTKKDKELEKDGKKTEKKRRQKSKYTDQEECLLKTKLPLNAMGNLGEDNFPKKRKKNRNAREITVHEFEKTTKFPTFLKDTAPESQSKSATEFVDGKGWVDEEGNVVEPVKAKPVPAPAVKKPKKSKPVEKIVEKEEEEDDDSTSSSGTSSSGTSSDEDSDEESEEEEESEKAETKKPAVQKNEEPASDHDEPVAQPEYSTPISAIKADSTRPMSSSSSRSLTIKIPPPITPSANKVHPLEALYKRSKPDGSSTETPAQQAQPFSFFDADIDEEDGDGQPNPVVPMTPFTRLDFESRTTRSAAPTPDTAHPTRMRNFWAPDGDEEDLDLDDVGEEEGDGEEQGSETPGQSGNSEFQTWFWDNRRDLNRSWMNRRKTAAKEKRHRENKARASKAV